MAHVTYIRIDGLLGRSKPVEVTLNNRLNIFFGENGCGKTTLLRVLAAALDRDGAAMVPLAVRRAEVHVYSINRKGIYTLVWDREQVEKAPADNKKKTDVEFNKRGLLAQSPNVPWKITSKNSENVSFRGWKFSFLPTHRLYARPNEAETASRFYMAYDPSAGQEDMLDKAFTDALNRQWLQYYNKTLAEVRQVQEEGLRAVLRQVLIPQQPTKPQTDVELSVVHERVERFLKRQKYPNPLTLGTLDEFKSRYEVDDHLRRAVDNLSNVEQSIEEAVAPVSSFLNTVKKLFRSGKEIVQTDAELVVRLDTGGSISLGQLSSGEKHLLKILLTAMNVGENVILIDEPELSMHIDWQRAFVGTVSSLNGNCQQILASHSPEIMAEVPDECIFRL